jgi:hypothetical protein
VFFLDRLTSRSSRSLAVMIGFARSTKRDGRQGLRGSPEDALNCFVFHTSLRVSAPNPAFQLG